MKYKICSVHDSKMEEYGQPFFVAALGLAVRSFGDECKRVDANNNMSKHPEDFTLYHLGEFDSESGDFSSQAPRIIAQGRDYKV